MIKVVPNGVLVSSCLPSTLIFGVVTPFGRFAFPTRATGVSLRFAGAVPWGLFVMFVP